MSENKREAIPADELEKQMDEPISRRNFIRSGVMGLGAVAATGMLGKRAHAASAPPRQSRQTAADSGHESRKSPSDPSAAEVPARNRTLEALVAPIKVGTVLGSAHVTAIDFDARGLAVVSLRDHRGRHWDAEVCRRAAQDADLRPLAVTGQYSVFLRNSGNGSTRTDESVGRAVLAIADRVRRNEKQVARLALPSRKELWVATGYRHDIKG
jgi:hypothetical protein